MQRVRQSRKYPKEVMPLATKLMWDLCATVSFKAVNPQEAWEAKSRAAASVAVRTQLGTPQEASKAQNRASAERIAWPVPAHPHKARQVKGQPNWSTIAAAVTETGWDTTLVQSEEENEVEKKKSRKRQCLCNRRCGDVCQTPSTKHLGINFGKTDF